MKALKEKRIGLRSLWRRGLVILSLFALVFASCNATDDDDDVVVPPTTNPPVVVGPGLMKIEIKSAPTEKSYEGQPINLKGLEVLVRYEGGYQNNKYYTPESSGVKFSTYPPYAAGVLGAVSGSASSEFGWAAMRDYTLLVDLPDGNSGIVEDLQITDVVPIVRMSTWQYGPGIAGSTGNPDNSFPFTNNTLLLWDLGVDFNGPLGDEVYVDDYPKFSQYTLQAAYADGAQLDIKVTPDIPWEIKPLITNADGPGQLVMAIASNPLTVGVQSLAAAHTYVQRAFAATVGTAKELVWPKAGTPGVSASQDLFGPDNNGRGADPAIIKAKGIATVHIVKEKGITLVAEDGTTPITFADLDPYFYWMDDSSDAWEKKLIDKGAKIKIEYTGGEPRTFTVKEALDMNAVWHNLNPGTKITTYIPFGVKGIGETGNKQANSNKPIAFASNRTPEITINYRGAEQKLKMPVYNRYGGVTPEPIDGNQITVNMKLRDNDVAGMNATEFSKKVLVTASFTASSDATLEAKKVTLKFDETLYDNITYTLTSAPLVGNDAGDEKYLYYSMNFGKPAWFDKAYVNLDGTIGRWIDDWDGLTAGAATTIPAGEGPVGTAPVYEPYKTLGANSLSLATLNGIDAYGDCNNPARNGRESNIRFIYKPPVADYWGNTVSASARGTNLRVAWEGIHTR
jgi:hypothetical protein